jgi:hypothetical protein
VKGRFELFLGKYNIQFFFISWKIFRWWRDQNEDGRQKARSLIESGQLEIAGD